MGISARLFDDMFWWTAKRPEPILIVAIHTPGNELLRAAEEGDCAEVRRILQRTGAREADKTITPWHGGSTALMAAARKGRLECVELLLPTSDATARDRAQRTALMEAAHYGEAQCLAAILPHSDPGARCGLFGRDALMYSAISGSAACVALLAPLCDPAAVDENGLTALHHAAECGNDDCVAALLPISDPMALDGGGMTPVLRAAMSGHLDCVRMLLPSSRVGPSKWQGWAAPQMLVDAGQFEAAALIDAYMLARCEREALEEAARSSDAEASATPRRAKSL